MRSKSLRRALDGALAALVVFQTSRAYVPPAVHMWCGVAFLVLVVAHLWLNRAWVLSLGRGRWRVRRILQLVLVLFSLACFAALSLSSAMLGGVVDGSIVLGREMHLCASYGALLALGAHAGTHVWPKRPTTRIALVAWAAYGALCMVALGIPGYVTLAVPFATLSTAAPIALHLFDHASVFVFAGALGSLAMHLCKIFDNRKREYHEQPLS